MKNWGVPADLGRMVGAVAWTALLLALAGCQTAGGPTAAEERQKDLRELARRVPEARTKLASSATPLKALEILGYWENSLGMRFVQVPGTKVLFSIWETRVKDYAAYVAANSGVDGSWKSPGFAQGDAHPVVKVSWDDAVAFCRWLTETERKAGRLMPTQEYRLPTDVEWSYAVGIGDRESGGTPKDKDGKLKDVYPWGTSWPPPSGAGNYYSVLGVDSFERTSPAGSFKANQYGLFDMGGNVWEWCQDWYDGRSGSRVLRGASWDYFGAVFLLSSYRRNLDPDRRDGYYGFRVVLVGGSAR